MWVIIKVRTDLNQVHLTLNQTDATKMTRVTTKQL